MSSKMVNLPVHQDGVLHGVHYMEYITWSTCYMEDEDED